MALTATSPLSTHPSITKPEAQSSSGKRSAATCKPRPKDLQATKPATLKLQALSPRHSPMPFEPLSRRVRFKLCRSRPPEACKWGLQFCQSVGRFLLMAFTYNSMTRLCELSEYMSQWWIIVHCPCMAVPWFVSDDISTQLTIEGWDAQSSMLASPVN